MAEKNQQNLWSQILSETQNQQRFIGKTVLILGNKNVGKRTLLDSLHEISGTEFSKLGLKDHHPGKLRVVGSSSALDFGYLNVKNLDDQDDVTYTRMGFYLMDEEVQKNLLNIVLTEKTLKNLYVVIMLDYSKPWNFIEQLNKWIDLLAKSLQEVDIPLQQLEDMRFRVKQIYQKYREFVDNDEKAKVQQTQEQEQRDQPIPQGVLENNLGIPIMVVCNKSDFSEQHELKKQVFIQYHLRQYCQRYGASLLYTSYKTNTNLDVFYEYILHIQYGFQLKHKQEAVNHDSLFIPAGSDNPTLLKQSFPELDTNIDYTEFIKDPQGLHSQRQRMIMNSLLIQKNKFEGTAVTRTYDSKVKAAGRSSVLDNITQDPITAGQKQKNVHDFYKSLMEQKNQQTKQASQPGDRDEELKQKAEQTLFEKLGTTSGVTDSNSKKTKIQDLINKSKQNQNK